jgi:hypothetical protein
MLRAPLPNIQGCPEKGKFPDEQISACQACIKKNENPLNEPGTKYYFCRNRCYNNYSAGEIGCDYSDLVAKTLDQCSNPCKQVALPAAHPECSDNFDCTSEQNCINGKCQKKAASAVRDITTSSTSSPISTSSTASTASYTCFPLLFLIILCFILLILFLIISNNS